MRDHRPVRASRRRWSGPSSRPTDARAKGTCGMCLLLEDRLHVVLHLCLSARLGRMPAPLLELATLDHFLDTLRLCVPSRRSAHLRYLLLAWGARPVAGRPRGLGSYLLNLWPQSWHSYAGVLDSSTVTPIRTVCVLPQFGHFMGLILPPCGSQACGTVWLLGPQVPTVVFIERSCIAEATTAGPPSFPHSASVPVGST